MDDGRLDQDKVLPVTTEVRLHRVFRKKMGAKEYTMASVDLYQNGECVDTVCVFSGSDNPQRVELQVYKGMLSVRVV